MAITVKICGLKEVSSVQAAIEGGAAYLGYVFYPRSPRALDPDDAAKLIEQVPADRTNVAVIVDPDDGLVMRLAAIPGLGTLQLHGRETPARVQEIKARTGKRVIKALSIAGPDDLAAIEPYIGLADELLFDAKPPSKAGSLPGGNGVAFDWHLLADRDLGQPWLLSGGLDADNIEHAVQCSGARAIDVSSGVEISPGIKSPDMIRRFLKIAAGIEPAAMRDVRSKNP